MPARTVTVASSSGLHARPAAIFAQAACEQPAVVMIGTPTSAPVRASSILLLLTLDVSCGDEVTLSAEGDGAQESLEALEVLLRKDLDAELPSERPARN